MQRRGERQTRAIKEMKDMASGRWAFNKWIIDIPELENTTKGIK